MLEFSSELYLRHQLMVQRIAESFARTTGLDAYELECAAWDKFQYARKFYNDSVKEKTFIRQVARTAMIDFSNKEKKVANNTFSLDELMDMSDEDSHNVNNDTVLEYLSKNDDQYVSDLSVTVSEEAMNLVRAIVNEGVQTKTDCVTWGKEHGYTRTKVNYFMFEIGLAMQGKRLIVG